ncbi:hypothetical protein BT96DRAFT_1018063 [Gymnopus androsaceus JB14]|uniref:Zn(2)-C6 fungal-type domain-containing protein n=1 Tax=Gymnopus androsaceus JB14 TaxID=1447944 RepID=A0A6A4HTT4_9AGAR|nr:hypothetical protein BT96DRAFT_1018063 [Gymnopus androsaceus JB14]
MTSSIETTENNLPSQLQAKPQMNRPAEARIRCDKCRKKNLKCDRALPVCHNCSGPKECKYSAPSISHRGIPRCATCQKYGLKCDRDMPACNQCQLQGKPSECVYLPRRRRNAEDKITFEDDIETKTGTILKFGLIDNDSDDYVSSQSNKQDQSAISSSSSAPIATMTTMKFKASSYQASSSSYRRDKPLSTRGSVGGVLTTASTASYLLPSPDISSVFIRPWSHPQFAPLPSVILRTLSETRFAEMPDREAFDQHLGRFLKSLLPEMQESASLSSAAYMGVARYLATGELPPHASPFLQTWMVTHRLLPARISAWEGWQESNPQTSSDRTKATSPIILIPRDPVPENLALVLEEYQVNPFKYTYGDGKTLPEQSIFDRLPVQNELFDILAYAHREHNDSTALADEARKMGFAHITWPMTDIFVRLCPLCSAKNSQNSDSSRDDE